MAEVQFPWDELIDHITNDQRTVPVIGPELSTLPGQGGVSFDVFAAQQLAAKHGLQLGKATTLPQLAAALIGTTRNKAPICRDLAHLHRELIATLTPQTLPEPLRLLADIRDFPLFVSSTPDSLLAAAIKAARDRDPGPLVASLGSVTDLPRNWLQGPRPVLFQLFGRINALPDFALTEEDVLEFLHRMQSEAHRPEQLFDELRARHLLLIGLRLPDWAMRFFVRILHSTRLSDDTGQSIMIAGDSIARDPALVGFLRETGRRIYIYEEGSAADFVRELHKRWHGTQEEGWSTTVEGRALPAEPTDMAAGAVYISAGKADRSSAERLAAVLDAAGLDVWFDQNEAREGSRYERRLRQHLQQCDLFLPLLSPETEGASDALQKQEWQWAIERDEAAPDGHRFLLPVWVGQAAAPEPTATPFRRQSLQTAPGGQPSDAFVQECVAAVRRERTLRNV